MSSYKLLIHSRSASDLDQEGNIDVEITLENGDVYTATFFTLPNIESLFRKNAESGECAGGVYFWATDMIIVGTITESTIRKAIDDLIESDELRLACTKIKTVSRNR
jgi:hypothetical protein